MLESLKALYSRIVKVISEVKIPLLIIAVLALIIKFRDVLISILVKSGKSVFEDANKKSNTLQAIENKDNQEANKLIEKANKLPSEQKPVDVDWYKNEKK